MMTSTANSSAKPAAKKPSMIWVVDDDPDLRQMVGTYLIDQGYDVRSLSDSTREL